MRFPIARPSLLILATVCLPACGTVVYTAQVHLPFEALPEVPEGAACRVLIEWYGPADGAEWYLDWRREVGQSDAELSALLHESLDRETAELRSGQQVTGTVSYQDVIMVGESTRSSRQPFLIHATCLADDGWFVCDAPMERGRRSSVRCPYRRFAFEQGEPTLPEGSGIVVEYTPFPCSGRRDVDDSPGRGCGRGWSIVLHRIRWATASGSGAAP